MAKASEPYEINPVDSAVEMMNQKCIVMMKHGKHGEALACYDGMLKSFKPAKNTAHFMKGTILITLGKFEEAKKCFEEVLKSVPQDPHSHMNIAACETYLGRKKEALDFIKKAIRLAPKDVYILVGASLLSNELGEENKYMTKAVEINPYTAFAYMGAVAKEHLENPNTSSKAKESIRKTLNSSKRTVDEMKALEDASKKKKK